WMLKQCRGYDRLASTLTTLAILLMVLVPTVIVVYQGAHDAVQLMKGTDRVHFPSFDKLIDQANNWFSLQLDPKEIRTELGTKINDWLAPIATKTPTVLLDFIIGCFVFILALYYFLADGKQMLGTVMRLIPLEQHHQQRLIDEFDEISRAVVGA